MVETDPYLRTLLDQAAAEEAFLGSLRQASPVQVEAAGTKPASPPPVSLMITNRQRMELRRRGFSDATIRQMTPAEAHEHLGLNGPSSQPSPP